MSIHRKTKTLKKLSRLGTIHLVYREYICIQTYLAYNRIDNKLQKMCIYVLQIMFYIYN